MKAIWIALLLILPIYLAAAQEDEGDEKILETIKKIQEETEKQQEEDSSSDDYDDDDDGCLGCQLLFEGCAYFFDEEGCGEGIGELLWQYFTSLRFSPYPYSAQTEYRFSSVDYQDFENQKITSIQVSADLATHFDGTYGNINRLTAQLSALQLNVFNQTIFSKSASLTALSVNTGLSLLIGDFDLSTFAGAYLLTTTGTFMFSVGISSRLFLPARLYLDVYNLYAFLNGVTQFTHLAASLNLVVWRLSIGAGYNYNRIVGDIYSGPCLKIGFWM
ncbi:MAG: hypothetical protein JSV89_16550 [Spirochaetaceae bacterium]|nr:MAG: hypothetical protein JSV89_16550 [Spirochaetaceae bacterium]